MTDDRMSAVSHDITLLLDPRRLAVAGAIALAPRTADQIADRTGIDRREVLTLLGDLRMTGLVAVDGDRYVIDAEAARRMAASFEEEQQPMDDSIGYAMTADERKVLGRYFSGRVLNEIPRTRAKRLIVLERLCLEFVPGRRYSEAEVNDTLRAFHTDVATLRRSLVDEELLDRTRVDGETWYFRSGGRVEP